MAITKRRRRIAAGSEVRGKRLEEDRFLLAFNWEALGCSRNLALRLGDRLIPVPLPEGFPQEPIDFELKDLVVYGSAQSLSLTSTPHRVPSSVEISLVLHHVDAPIFLLLDGAQLFACLQSEGEEEEEEVLVPFKWDPDGLGDKPEHYWLYPEEKPEKCRPDCRWTSYIGMEVRFEWSLKRVQIPDHGEYVIHTYERDVQYHWRSYHCENGVWVHKRTDVDRQKESKRLKLFTKEPEWF